MGAMPPRLASASYFLRTDAEAISRPPSKGHSYTHLAVWNLKPGLIPPTLREAASRPEKRGVGRIKISNFKCVSPIPR